MGHAYKSLFAIILAGFNLVCLLVFAVYHVFLFLCFGSHRSGPNMHHSSSSSSMSADQTTRGVAVEKLETVKKWGLNTYKVEILTNEKTANVLFSLLFIFFRIL